MGLVPNLKFHLCQAKLLQITMRLRAYCSQVSLGNDGKKNVVLPGTIFPELVQAFTVRSGPKEVGGFTRMNRKDL